MYIKFTHVYQFSSILLLCIDKARTILPGRTGYLAGAGAGSGGRRPTTTVWPSTSRAPGRRRFMSIFRAKRHAEGYRVGRTADRTPAQARI